METGGAATAGASGAPRRGVEAGQPARGVGTPWDRAQRCCLTATPTTVLPPRHLRQLHCQSRRRWWKVATKQRGGAQEAKTATTTTHASSRHRQRHRHFASRKWTGSSSPPLPRPAAVAPEVSSVGRMATQSVLWRKSEPQQEPAASTSSDASCGSPPAGCRQVVPQTAHPASATIAVSPPPPGC